jgi:heptaprenylglyceryl phosphate synthase
VIPSDYAQIPFPAVSASGVNTSVVASELVDSTAKFLTNNVVTGDIVYNTVDGTAATVVKVLSETAIQLNANIFTATGKSYKVYAGNNTNGCVLYVGTAGALDVVTVGGDTVTFAAVLAGQFIPVHVLQVKASSSASNIVALW